MPAYIVAENRLHDPEKFKLYVQEAVKLITAHGGRVLVAADEADIREGKKCEPRTAIIEFPSLEAARRWYESAEYQPVKRLRQEATTGSLFIVDGFVPPR